MTAFARIRGGAPRCAILAILAAFLAAAVPAGSAARPAASRVFVQVWFEGTFPTHIDPASDPGRIEMWSGEVFVGCAKASVTLSRWGEPMLGPLEIGYVVPGPAEAVRVQVFGELARSARLRTKITPSPDKP